MLKEYVERFDRFFAFFKNNDTTTKNKEYGSEHAMSQEEFSLIFFF